jgi:hypothetical protein
MFHKDSQKTTGHRDRINRESCLPVIEKMVFVYLVYTLKSTVEDLAKSECEKLQDSEKAKDGKEEKFHQRNRKLSEVFAMCMSQPSFLYNHMLITLAGVILSGTTFG